MYECYAKSQYFSYLRADGRIHDNVPEAGGRAEGSDREHGAELHHPGSSAGPRAWSRWSSWSRRTARRTPSEAWGRTSSSPSPSATATARDVTSARSGRTPVRAGGVTTFADVSWGPVAVHSGSIFNHVDVLDLVRVVINLLLRLGLFFPDPTQSHMATE